MDNYVYSGYGIGLDLHSEFSLADGSLGKNVIIFEVDMSSSVHIVNKNKDNSFLGEGPTHGSDDTTLTAEAQYSINFQVENFVWVCIIMGATVFYLLMLKKINQFKAKATEIKKHPLCIIFLLIMKFLKLVILPILINT